MSIGVIDYISLTITADIFALVRYDQQNDNYR